MTSEQLRILAASESAYVAARMVTYREDGTAPPEAIRKLGALADAVLAALPGLGVQQDVASLTERAERACVAIYTARAALYDIGVTLDMVNADLDRRLAPLPMNPIARAFKTLADPVPTALDLSTVGSDIGKGSDAAVSATDSANPSPSPVPHTAGEGAADGLCVLRHGLVLVNAAGDRRLFSEPAIGQWAVQTVAPDGFSAGEPFSTFPEKWSDADWHEDTSLVIKPALRRYDEELRPPVLAPVAPKAKLTPAADRTLALPGMADVVPPPRKTIKDYAPDDAQFTTWTAALSKSAKVAIDEGVVRTCFVAWQIDHCDEEKPNPAALFWHHAKASLVPATKPNGG